jgi:DNA-binding PadR family transcriptional regulator
MADGLGIFEQAVLLALAAPVTDLGKQAYGRAILVDVQARLARGVSAGAVYATLDRLESKGLVSSRLGEGTASRGGRPRRYYRLKAAGLRALRDSRRAVDRLWADVPHALGGKA